MRHGNTSSDSDFFKTLFHTKNAPALIRKSLKSMPHSFAEYFAGVADEVYAALESTVVSSVWRRSRVVPEGVLVQSKDLSVERVEPFPEFVSSVMRSFRNAHHGYFTASDKSRRPSRYLFMVTGNLPVELSALPVLWWLSFLSDPSFLGWKHLPLAEFN